MCGEVDHGEGSGTDGAQLPALLDNTTNTASEVWADTAYRSAKNEAHLKAGGFTSCIHRKKPQGKPLPKHVSPANAAKSVVRAHVEHVFALQKGPMALVIRTIGLARAKVKVGFVRRDDQDATRIVAPHHQSQPKEIKLIVQKPLSQRR